MNRSHSVQCPRKNISTYILFFLVCLSAGTGCGGRVALPQIGDIGSSQVTRQSAEEAWGRVLVSSVDRFGRIDFKKVAKNPVDLNTYIYFISRIGPSTHPNNFIDLNDRLAHYINSYNALAMYGVIQSNIPEDFYSFSDRYKFFKSTKFQVDNQWISLYDYENDWILPVADRRIHFVLNCMTVSCPRLPRKPFEGPILDEQLTRAAHEFMNTHLHVEVRPRKETVKLSQIFEMYPEEFPGAGEDLQELLKYVNSYRIQKIPETYEIKFKPYLWFTKRQPN